MSGAVCFDCSTSPRRGHGFRAVIAARGYDESVCQDRITGHEDYATWGIDPKRWLPT